MAGEFGAEEMGPDFVTPQAACGTLAILIESSYNSLALSHLEICYKILNMTQAEKIEEWVKKQRRGTPFSSRSLLKFASRGMVDQTLSTFSKEGKLKRLLPGLYVKPMMHPILGEMTVPEKELIEAYCRHSNEIIRPSGAEAVNRLGLSTQVPVCSTYLTSGRSRKLKVGSHSVSLRQTHPKFLRLGGQAGDVVRAFRYLGRDGVTKEHLLQISRILDDGAKRALLEYLPCLPAWMGSKIKILAELS